MNGISGIGTGFSCSIPAYNPMDVVQYLKDKLENKRSSVSFIPYYEGFKGTITQLEDNHKFLVKGCYEKINDKKIRITELPIGTWTMPYTSFLETLVDGTTDKSGKKIAPTLRDFTSTCTEVNVDFEVVFPQGKLEELEAQIDANGCNGVFKMLKLATTISNTNMHMFNADCKLHKYGSIEEIIDDFYGVRIAFYEKRKMYLINELEQRLVLLSNRAKYIQENLNGSIDLRKKKMQQVVELLESKEYVRINGDYNYLTKMAMDSVTEERVETIMKEKADTEMELETLRKTSLEKMWITELKALEKEYGKYKTHREQLQLGNGIKKTTQKKVVKKRAPKKK